MTSSGIYIDTLQGSGDCDSIVTTYLTIDSSYISALQAIDTCDSYISPSGQYVWTTSGIYYDTLTTIGGCDSIIGIDLTILNHLSQSLLACDSLISPSGQYIWTTSGVYNDTVPGGSGCDSWYTINLTILSLDETVTAIGDSALFSLASGVSYQWLDCGNNYSLIPGETGQTFTPIAVNLRCN